MYGKRFKGTRKIEGIDWDQRRLPRPSFYKDWLDTANCSFLFKCLLDD